MPSSHPQPHFNMSTFTSYSTPPPNARFSKSWFQSLTVDEAIRIPNYPRIAPENSLKHWVFGPDVPTGARATTIAPSEVVLSNSDLAPIYKDWERSYNEDGSRSVYVSYTVDGEEYQYIQLIKLINNYDDARKQFIRLVDYLEHPTAMTGQAGGLVGPLKACYFLEGLAGFYSTSCPLYKLGSLLGEQWVHEDIFHASCEHEYFR
ncbi:hypothetical protein FA13DRAFT_1648709, partial [Coprinellus micaceus]